MFQGYRRTYRNIRLLRKAAERERIERSDEPAEEILENIDIDAEESIIVDDTNLGILEDEKWEFISTENDDNNEDTDDSVPLYENASITLKAFVDELMNAKIKSGTSDRGHEMYLSVIKKALPQPNRLFTSLEGTRNYLSRGKYTLSNEAIYEDLEGGKLVIYNAKRRINDIFKMYKKEIISYTEEMLSSPYLKDSICGELYKTIRNVDKDIFTIGVQMHFDDAHFNITNRTHKIYPISLRILNLPISIRNKFQFYIPLAIYYGEKIPVHSMEKKIERTFESFKLFTEELFIYNGKLMKYNIKVINITADIIAKNEFFMMKSFRHTYGCSLCLTQCSTISKRSVYPSAEGCTYRTRDSMVENVNNVLRSAGTINNYQGHTNKLPMFFEYIIYPYPITVDWFHSVLQGSFHNDMRNIFISGFYLNNQNFLTPPLSEDYKELFNYIIENNKISRCFARKPRKLQNFDSYKGSEMKLIFLYIFPLATYSIINLDDGVYSRYILNIFLQISLIGSLLKDNLTKNAVEFIENALFKWHSKRVEIISKIFYSTMKCHEITHLPYVTKYHGSINCFSTFAGEASLHDLNSLLSSLSMENVLSQITKRLDDKWFCYVKPNFSIADIQKNVIDIELPEYVINKFPNEVRILKNSNYLSLLTKGKILNNITSNLERNVIDQDSYIYIKEANQEAFLPYIVEYIVVDGSNDVFFITREILISGTFEKYIVHNDIEVVDLIKQTNFFKAYFEVKGIGKNLKIFNARLKKLAFINGIHIKTRNTAFICPLNSYEHN